jgi:prevent-host-death family protein
VKTATITETKNNLSALLDRGRRGETILILDRGRPVARLESVLEPGSGGTPGRLARLERAGLLERSRRGLPRKLMLVPPPRPASGTSALAALLEERRETR